MSEQKQQPRILDLNKFTLFADIPNVQKQRARLAWGIRGGNPRITVFAFNPTSNRNEVMAAPIPPDVFIIFCDQFLKALESGQTGIKAKINNMVSVRDSEGKPTNEKRLLSELWYGIDESGIAWLSVTEGDKPRIKFSFSIWGYSVIYKTDGTPLSESEASRMSAIATMQCIKQIYMQNMAEFVEYSAGSNGRSNTAANTAPASTRVDASVLEDINF